MLDQEIKDYIKNEIEKSEEKLLKLLPQVGASLLTDLQAEMEINKKFYSDHKEFKGHSDSVKSVLAEIDGKHPLKTLDEKLALAVPGIKQRIKDTEGLSMTVNPTPDVTFKKVDAPSNNGKI